MGGFNLDDYVDVPERIRQFREQHPEGTLQSEILPLPESFAAGFVAVKAYAYRTPDDPRPGVGIAWEKVPGATPYTKESELMNAETSAWGRAIVAVGAADTKRGIASKNEVASRQPDRPAPRAPKSATELAGPTPDDKWKEEPAEPQGELLDRAEMIKLRKAIRAGRPDHPAVLDGSIGSMTLEELKGIAQ